eukprot:5802664-Pyramimonas_sp.AAC.2
MAGCAASSTCVCATLSEKCVCSYFCLYPLTYILEYATSSLHPTCTRPPPEPRVVTGVTVHEKSRAKIELFRGIRGVECTLTGLINERFSSPALLSRRLSKFRGSLNSPLVERTNKRVTAVWSPYSTCSMYGEWYRRAMAVPPLITPTRFHDRPSVSDTARDS